MQDEGQTKTVEPTVSATNARLSARVFYGVIVAGVLLGISACVSAGWGYLQTGDRKPTGRRIWDADAETFVIPICVMVGATFGGMAGFAVAVLLEKGNGRRQPADKKLPPAG